MAAIRCPAKAVDSSTDSLVLVPVHSRFITCVGGYPIRAALKPALRGQLHRFARCSRDNSSGFLAAATSDSYRFAGCSTESEDSAIGESRDDRLVGSNPKTARPGALETSRRAKTMMGARQSRETLPWCGVGCYRRPTLQSDSHYPPPIPAQGSNWLASQISIGETQYPVLPWPKLR